MWSGRSGRRAIISFGGVQPGQNAFRPTCASPFHAKPCRATPMPYSIALSAEAEIKFPLPRVDGDRPRRLSSRVDNCSARNLADIDLVVKAFRRGISEIGIAGHYGRAPGPNRSPRSPLRPGEVIVFGTKAAVRRIGSQPIRIIR